MSPEQIFSIVSTAALPGWLALAIAPLRRDLAVLVARVIVGGLAVAYVLTLGSVMAGLTPQEAAHTGTQSGGMPDYSSLAGVMTLLGAPWGATVGWTHFLAFDLFIGAWQVETAGRRNIPHWMVLPCLVLTFLFGPAGLLLFFGVLSLRGRTA